MFAGLVFILLALFVLLLIDSFSTLLGLIVCVLTVYYCVYNFTDILNKRFIVLVAANVWNTVSFFIHIKKQLHSLCERFFLTGKKSVLPPSHCNTHFCGSRACLENEVNALVLNISQYYIRSWYDKIGGNDEFLSYLNSSINDTLIFLCTSVSKVDKRKFSCTILQVYLNFFSHFVEAKKKSEVFKSENFQMKHWAMKDHLTEWCYLQSLVSTLLDSFCPSENERCLHSKYSPLLHCVVVEILTQSIIHPLVRVLCDPTRLNLLLLKLVLNSIKTSEDSNNYFDNVCPHQSILPFSKKYYQNKPIILLPNEDLSDDSVFEQLNTQSQNLLSVPDDCSASEVQNKHFGFGKKNSSKKCSYIKSSDHLPCFISSGIKSCSNTNLFDHEDLRIPDYDNCPGIKRSRSADYIRQIPQLKALNEKDYNIVLQSESNKMLVALKSDVNSSTSIEQAEEAVEVQVPTLFTDVEITDTFQQNEAGLLPFTLYCIQYTSVFHDTGKSSDIPHFVKQVVSIKRRFREFVALQSRLEDNPLLKMNLKVSGIKGPSKWIVPFSNLDKKNIAERRSFLESYLRELCDSAPIAQSSELQEFLAYGGEERIVFVKRAGDVSVPRINKLLVRGVKGAIDIFKTALPNSPLDDDNVLLLPRLTFEDDIPDLRFQEHLLDYSSHEPEIKQHMRNFMENSTFEVTSEDLKNSESKNTSLLRKVHYFKTTECCNCPLLCENSFLQEECPFGNIIMELAAVSFELNESSIGDTFSVLKLLSAPCINRFFENKLDDISEEHLTTLLHILHKYLWPDGRSSNENTISLGNLVILNTIMEHLDVLLSSNFVIRNLNSTLRQTLLQKIYLFLLSIQHQETNKCLLFHIFDVIIQATCSKDI